MNAGDFDAIVMGASAGAVEALMAILPELPADFPLPVLVVIHVPPDRKNALAALFADTCRVEVKEAEDKEEIRGGVVYFAPANYHLLVETDRTLSLSVEEPVHYSRPAIDVLFETAADAFGERLMGIVMTGASKDGAAGLRAIGEAGGLTLVQDPGTAEVAVMPMAALGAWPAARPLSLNGIAALLTTLNLDTD